MEIIFKNTRVFLKYEKLIKWTSKTLLRREPLESLKPGNYMIILNVLKSSLWLLCGEWIMQRRGKAWRLAGSPLAVVLKTDNGGFFFFFFFFWDTYETDEMRCWE